MDGYYRGIYRKAYPSVDFQPSNVTLVLSKGNFTVTKQVDTFSISCSGSWWRTANTISFKSACTPTGFARERILDSSWQLTNFPDSINMYRAFPDGLQEWYYLKKQF